MSSPNLSTEDFIPQLEGSSVGEGAGDGIEDGVGDGVTGCSAGAEETEAFVLRELACEELQPVSMRDKLRAHSKSATWFLMILLLFFRRLKYRINKNNIIWSVFSLAVNRQGRLGW